MTATVLVSRSDQRLAEQNWRSECRIFVRSELPLPLIIATFRLAKVAPDFLAKATSSVESLSRIF
jgi:hypothetical protein